VAGHARSARGPATDSASQGIQEEYEALGLDALDASPDLPPVLRTDADTLRAIYSAETGTPSLDPARQAELRARHGTGTDDDLLILRALMPEQDIAAMQAAGPVRRDFPLVSREVAEIEAELADAGVLMDPARLAAAAERHRALQEELSRLMREWESLSETVGA